MFETHENIEHLALMERILGPIPTDMIQGCKCVCIILCKLNWITCRKEAKKYFSGDMLNWPEMASSGSSERFVGRKHTLEVV